MLYPQGISNNIIFRFAEEILSGRFVNSTKSGIIVNSGDGNQSNLPRWGLVESVGQEVYDVSAGDYVLVDHGRWTTGFYVGDNRYWKTDEESILLISDEPQTTY